MTPQIPDIRGLRKVSQTTTTVSFMARWEGIEICHKPEDLPHQTNNIQLSGERHEV
jgi:hypothetical protein